MEKMYVVGYMEKDKEKGYEFHIVSEILKDKDTLIRITEEQIMNYYQALEELNSFEIYALFVHKFKVADKESCVAEFYIQEMRTDTTVIKFKVYELKD